MILTTIAVVALATSAAQAPAADPRAEEIKVSQDAVAKLLRDPESARFIGVYYNEKTGAVCGRVNGHNAYGGYGENLEFIAYGNKAVLFTGTETIEQAAALGISRDRLFGGCPPG